VCTDEKELEFCQEGLFQLKAGAQKQTKNIGEIFKTESVRILI